MGVKFAKIDMNYYRRQCLRPGQIGNDKALKSLTVVFVNSRGERVDRPVADRPAKEPRVIEHQPDPPGVKFVR